MNQENCAGTAWAGEGAVLPRQGEETENRQKNAGTGAGARCTAKEEETRETKRLKESFGFFGPAAFLYGVFYAFCMYRNGSGITFPFFAAGSLLFLCLSLSKLEITLKKGSAFYMAAIIALGVSTFCTDDARMIFFNKLGVFLLTMSLLLNQFYDTSKWKLGKYLGSICRLTFACMEEIPRPVRDGSQYQKEKGGRVDKRVWQALLGLAAGVPLLAVVLLLLTSADVVFRQMTEALLENINLESIMNVLCRIAFLFFASYALLAYLCKRKIPEGTADRRKGEPVAAITAAVLLTAVYLLFSGVQIAGLFLGKLRLPAGYTYAAYAREGFFQLLAVSILNLVIVLAAMSFFRESRVLKAVLTVMCLCTFVMIASSAMRMLIYIWFYYLTFLRILVLWALLLLAVLFAGVIIDLYKENFSLFRYGLTAVTVMYLGLSFAHPDLIIAQVNIAGAPRQESLGAGPEAADGMEERAPYRDFAYLGSLSADAAPVLVPYMEELGYSVEAFGAPDAVQYGRELMSDTFSRYSYDGFGYYWMSRLQDRTENFGIRTYNVSRHIALISLKAWDRGGR